METAWSLGARSLAHHSSVGPNTNIHPPDIATIATGQSPAVAEGGERGQPPCMSLRHRELWRAPPRRHAHVAGHAPRDNSNQPETRLNEACQSGVRARIVCVSHTVAHSVWVDARQPRLQRHSRRASSARLEELSWSAVQRGAECGMGDARRGKHSKRKHAAQHGNTVLRIPWLCACAAPAHASHRESAGETPLERVETLENYEHRTSQESRLRMRDAP